MRFYFVECYTLRENGFIELENYWTGGLNDWIAKLLPLITLVNKMRLIENNSIIMAIILKNVISQIT